MYPSRCVLCHVLCDMCACGVLRALCVLCMLCLCYACVCVISLHAPELKLKLKTHPQPTTNLLPLGNCGAVQLLVQRRLPVQPPRHSILLPRAGRRRQACHLAAVGRWLARGFRALCSRALAQRRHAEEPTSGESATSRHGQARVRVGVRVMNLRVVSQLGMARLG